MSNWKPISTAPKDGTDVLISTHDLRMCVGSWMTVYRAPMLDPLSGLKFSSGWESEGFMYSNSKKRVVAPTHWQPLPDPPK